MLNSATFFGLNHVLAQQAWARQQLLAFGGRIIEVRLPPLPDLRLRITADGYMHPAPPDAAADLRILVRPSALPYILLRDEAALRQVDMVGSPELAQVLQQLFRDLEWDFEEDLSRLFGDVLAHRMAGMGRDLVAWQREAGLRLAQNFAEYWTEEQPMIARSEDLARFSQQVEELRDDVERLEKRIENLPKQASR